MKGLASNLSKALGIPSPAKVISKFESELTIKISKRSKAAVLWQSNSRRDGD
jgi:hypothetical protein